MSKRPAEAAQSIDPITRRHLTVGLKRDLLRLAAPLIVALVLGGSFVTLSMYVMNAARSFVTGEGNYSRAQKGAALHLLRYAQTGDPAEWDAYLENNAISKAFGSSLIALSSDPPDREAAARALIDAQNHPSDVPGIIHLFAWAPYVPNAQRAMDLWAAGDAEIRALDAVALELRAAIRDPHTSPEVVAGLLERVSEIDDRLTVLEAGFSIAVSDLTRGIAVGVVGFAWIAALVVLTIGLIAVGLVVRAMRKGSEIFRTVIERANDIITILDVDSRILYESPAIGSLGYTPDELEGRLAIDFVHPEDVPIVETALATGVTEPATAEFRFRAKDGSWRIIAAASGPLPMPGGNRALVVNSRDVTEERAIERRLAESDRLDSIGRLAGGVAHDFNNLITVIGGTTTMLRRGATDPEAITDLDIVSEACERAGQLTGQLLTFARREVLEPVVLDVNEALRDLDSMLGRLVDDSTRIELDLCDGVAAIRADRAQLDRLVINLTVNAAEAMQAGGTVRISTQRIMHEPGADGELPPGPYVEIDVADTGTAMSEEVRARVFEPFFTTKPDGTGIGLATCYGIVRQNGGTIDLESKPGQGTRFFILWPEVTDAELAAVSRVEPVEVRGTQTILYAEDEPPVRRIVVRMLESEGFRVLVASDGREALQIAQAGQPFDLLLTDVSMPHMNGRELAEEVAKLHPATPVVFVSGYTEDADLRDRVGAHDVRFIAKPFDSDAFLRTVHEALGG